MTFTFSQNINCGIDDIKIETRTDWIGARVVAQLVHDFFLYIRTVLCPILCIIYTAFGWKYQMCKYQFLYKTQIYQLGLNRYGIFTYSVEAYTWEVSNEMVSFVV